VIPVGAMLSVSAALFAIGVVCLLARKPFARALMGLPLALSGAALAFATFARVRGAHEDGRAFAFLVVGLAAAGVLAGLALLGRGDHGR
jgi:NADH-quinone oxidoreductase subunit K